MIKPKISRLILIKVVLWATIYFSGLALIYHTRWFVTFLLNNNVHFVVPVNEVPFVWFIIQICTNLIFLYVSYLLIKLFKRYRKTGYFDEESLKVFNGVILSCLGLAILGATKIAVNNFSEVHIAEWNSFAAIINLFFRSFTRLLVINGPQTMYLLLAIILWSVKQFVTSALDVKKENESFV